MAAGQQGTMGPMIKSALSSRARQTLRVIRRHGGISRSALIRETGLTNTAVFRATEELEAAGLVRAGDTQSQGRGQPSTVMHIVPDAAFSLGLSLMTDRADVVLLDLAGEVRARRELTIAGMPRDATLDAVADFAREALAVQGVPRKRLLGLGIAISGYFVGADMVNPGHELDDWAMINLDDAVSERLDWPVMIENIGNASALGEHLFGVGAGLRSFCYVNVAAGFGAGLIVDGRVMRGHNGNAGEIAGLFHLAGRVTPNLVDLRDWLVRHGTPLDDIGALVERFDPGWPGVDAWVRDRTPDYAYLFGALRYVLDCEAVVLGGRLPRSLAQHIVDAIEWPEARLPPRRNAPAPFPALHVARLEPQMSGSLGAASLLLHRELLG
jgi:predicted NBD/HSP70 family sugar kinase